MKNRIIIILFCCCFYNSSCKKGEPQERQILTQLGDKTSPDYYLIVPIKGCAGCVTEMLAFIKENVKNPRITFILTSNEPKLFNLILSKEDVNSNNILLDHKNLFEKSGIVTGPNFLLLKNGSGDFVERKVLNATNLTVELTKLKTLII